jgi:orotidine-5'-phosphate decarboxylase
MANMTLATRTEPIVALDFPTADAALTMVDRLGASCRFFKVGSELYTKEGPQIVRRLVDSGCDLFLDLKFHDIPNTVGGAVRAAANLGVRLLTVHASGGRSMLEAARDAAGSTRIFAVSVLTSLDGAGLGEAWGRQGLLVSDEVLRLADLARAAGVHGLVCSGAEAARVNAEHGDALEILVPGIRFATGQTHDQARVVTPREAAVAGARYIVVGRAVTGSEDPGGAMRAVRAELSA